MIGACAKEFVQSSAEFTIRSTQAFAEVANRAKFVRELVERLGCIGDVYWSSNGSVEVEPTDKPVFALTMFLATRSSGANGPKERSDCSRSRSGQCNKLGRNFSPSCRQNRGES